MYQRILVATDGSSSANEALEQGIKLVKENQGLLMIVYVVPTHIGGIGFFRDNFKKVFREEGEKILNQAKGMAEREGIHVRTYIEEGHPFEKIVELAKDTNTELIIMGSHGRTGLKKVLLGSVAERVIKNAPCPVLVVKKD
ncbi:MAG: universal stress protein [Deltaproteobacteria bacterium]|nr:universal stress protein [Deltaproteobacteria bacterium]